MDGIVRKCLLVLILGLIGCSRGRGTGSSGEAGASGTGGCEDCSDACGSSDPRCWCPNPQCENQGCIDGVAWACKCYGDCCDQLPARDCAASGETCWLNQWGEGECKPAGCGDGVVQDGEACDEGADNGTRLDACTTSCTVPPAAVLDQRNAGDGVALEALHHVQNDHGAFQTFTPAKSGRLAWIAADVEYGGLFVLEEGGTHQLLAPSQLVHRSVDGTYRREHHFLQPVRVEAGKQYAFALQCGDHAGCDLQVTRGDRYVGGAVQFRAYPAHGGEVPPAPADADLPFETWVIEEDDGCGPESEPSCAESCEQSDFKVWATCVAGIWSCGDGVDLAGCTQ